jgi:PAS domain S-box-containing protein
MSFSLLQILLFIVAYLTVLFTVAHLADKGIIPKAVSSHPLTYVLSLGVFAGALATNGIFMPAAMFGSSYLLYYAGAVMMFILAPLLLLPLLRICRVYQLNSIADVLTFRFRSRWVGAAITIGMCLTMLPLIALQIQAVADSIHFLGGDIEALLPGQDRKTGLALLFCIIITVFSMLFGTRHISSQRRNTGLVTAIAFESLVKMLALLLLFGAAVYGGFGGFDAMESWLEQQLADGMLQDFGAGDHEARALLLLFFASAVCLPHVFHMTFAENPRSRDLRTASWGLPLYLLVISLPILPITWAAIKLNTPLPAEYSGLALGMLLGSPALTAVAFTASLSAASATIIISTLALANMCVNHLVLPGQFIQINTKDNIFDRLKWLRRTLITILIAASFIFFLALDGKASLSQLGLSAFVGVLQFLPGIVATPYWRGANRKGLLAGLTAGLAVWFIAVFLPVTDLYSADWANLANRDWSLSNTTLWSAISLISLLINCATFVLASLLTKTSEDERVAAEICSISEFTRPVRQTLAHHSIEEFEQQLSNALGERTAATEVQRALRQLRFAPSEDRPYALQQLRNRIEANLSGMLGPTVAGSIINRCLPFQAGNAGSTEYINLVERKLDGARLQFTGLAADLDNLRRHYRETLNNLPIGVFSCDRDTELIMWNRNMEDITGIPGEQAIGSRLTSLAPPWGPALIAFYSGSINTVLKTEIPGDQGHTQWISLHRAATENSPASGSDDRVILVEDITDYELMEQELLHNERLASIGRLAAGVAHEIGNPVTGIACLAQNLAYETEPDLIQNTAEDILKQTDRVTRIVQSLVNFSHAGSNSGDIIIGPCNIADCIDEAIHLLQLDREAKAIAYRNDCDRELLVVADSQRLLQVFINLLGNARDACGEDGLAIISAHTTSEQVNILVEDNGCGIPTEIQQQVFEPFFTTKDPGEGTGLGLSLVYSIMEDMNGNISLQSPTDELTLRGTRFSLQLPRGGYGQEFDL